MRNEYREAQFETTLSSKVVTFEFNQGRPAVDGEEKRRVKRNLFREDGGGKSSVNRKLRAQLKAKKQLFRSNPVPYQGRTLSHHEDRQVAMTERVSSLVASKHRPFQCPVEPSPNMFSLKDDNNDKPRRGSAEMSRTQFPGHEIVEDVYYDRNPFHDFSPSFPPPLSSAVSPAKWRGFVTGESSTSLELYCPSSQRLEYRYPLHQPQIAETFRDHSLPSHSSPQDNKLFCSSFPNVEYSSYFPNSTNICTPMINWVLENNDWEDASPVRNM